MYCPKCGGEVSEEADVCVHCGCSLNKTPKEFNEPKTGIGVVMALFLGLIGLIIGILIYPTGTVARRTFIKAWCITYAVVFGVAILFMIIVIAALGPSLAYYY